MTLKTARRLPERGFTIVELMIALTVLSTILVMATFILIQIGGLYSKGVNAANLQNASRNVMSDISGTLQLSGNKPASCTGTSDTCYGGSNSSWNEPSGDNVTVYAYCINTTRYSYVMKRQVGTDSDGKQAPHGLWRDTMSNSARCAPLDITKNKVLADADSIETAGTQSKGFDMVPQHMRLIRFYVQETPANSGHYSITINMAYGDRDLLTTDWSGCKGGDGSQYCATSQLSSSVTRRVN